MSLRLDRDFGGNIEGDPARDPVTPPSTGPATGPAPAPAPGPRRLAARHHRLGELDVLRFVAALSVVAFHYMAASRSLWGVQPTRIFPSVARLTTLGILGVELFFVISGFVILMSVLGRSAGEFAASRFSRLFPAYWFSVVAIFLVYTLSDLQGFRVNLTLRDYLINLTMLQEGLGVGHASGVYWSLWVELRFYVLIGILALIGITLRRVLIFMGFWLVLSAYAVGAGSGVLQTILIPHHAPYFIAGMAFFIIYRYGSSLIPWAIVVASWAFALKEATVRVAGRVKLVGAKDFPAPEWAVVVAVTVIFVLMALVAVHALGWLRWRGLMTIGALTYPLYLLHQTVSAIIIPAFDGSLNPWLIIAITLGTSLALAHLVWRFVEKPAQRLLKPRLAASLRAIGEMQVKPPTTPASRGQNS